MSLKLVIQLIGWSHLLQPPLTLLLARKLGLAPAFSALPPIAAQIARNMAIASVGLPTATGVLVAIAAEEIVTGGCLRYLAWMIAAFWSWRLYRQTIIGPLMPAGWHRGLSAIFVVQGPVLAMVLSLVR